MAILIITFGTLAAGLVARGEPAGADARAYWAAVRIWLGGGDPYRPTGPFLPYVYAPWMLPVFAPWALLPWDVAWYVWRGGTILAFLWSVHWAYSRRPLTTRPDGRSSSRSRSGRTSTPATSTCRWRCSCSRCRSSVPCAAGAIWAMATWMKWVPGRLRARHRSRGRGSGACCSSPCRSCSAWRRCRRRSPSSRRLFGFGPATDPARLPRLPLGPRPGPLAPDRPVRLVAAGLVARPVGRAACERRSRTRQVRGWVGIPYGSAGRPAACDGRGAAAGPQPSWDMATGRRADASAGREAPSPLHPADRSASTGAADVRRRPPDRRPIGRLGSRPVGGRAHRPRSRQPRGPARPVRPSRPRATRSAHRSMARR